MFRTEERLSRAIEFAAGSGLTIAVRNVLRGLHEEDEAVITCAAMGALKYPPSYPLTAWKDSFIHNAFENAARNLQWSKSCLSCFKEKGKVKSTP